jgi:hypothetical protein
LEWRHNSSIPMGLQEVCARFTDSHFGPHRFYRARSPRFALSLIGTEWRPQFYPVGSSTFEGNRTFRATIFCINCHGRHRSGRVSRAMNPRKRGQGQRS